MGIWSNANAPEATLALAQRVVEPQSDGGCLLPRRGRRPCLGEARARNGDELLTGYVVVDLLGHGRAFRAVRRHVEKVVIIDRRPIVIEHIGVGRQIELEEHLMGRFSHGGEVVPVLHRRRRPQGSETAQPTQLAVQLT